MERVKNNYNFIQYSGDLIGLPTTDNHLVFRWATDIDCKILFSATQHGKAISGHYASDKKGKPYLKQAINEFCEFLFDIFDWCKMIIGMVNKKSVMETIEDCGFNLIFEDKENNQYIYARCR